jgi:tripartite-type tricarboxylate transporter receptor subunit TctC
MIFDNIPQALAEAREGKVRALAVTGAQRSPQAPEIPTMAEFLPGFEITSWGAVCGPAAMPRAAVERLSALTRRALESPDLARRFEELGATVVEVARRASERLGWRGRPPATDSADAVAG